MCDVHLLGVWHDACMRVTWRIHMCDMTHAYALHASFICVTDSYEGGPVLCLCPYQDYIIHMIVTWRIHTLGIHMCEEGPCSASASTGHSYVCRDAYIHWATRLIHMCDMTHTYVCHDAFICVTWLIHICDMTTWRTHVCDMTHAYVWHDAFKCGNDSYEGIPLNESSINDSHRVAKTHNMPYLCRSFSAKEPYNQYCD